MARRGARAAGAGMGRCSEDRKRLRSDIPEAARWARREPSRGGRAFQRSMSTSSRTARGCEKSRLVCLVLMGSYILSRMLGSRQRMDWAQPDSAVATHAGSEGRWWRSSWRWYYEDLAVLAEHTGCGAPWPVWFCPTTGELVPRSLFRWLAAGTRRRGGGVRIRPTNRASSIAHRNPRLYRFRTPSITKKLVLRARTTLCTNSHGLVAEPGVVDAIKTMCDDAACRGGVQEHSRGYLSIGVSKFSSPIARVVPLGRSRLPHPRGSELYIYLQFFPATPHSCMMGATMNALR